MQFLTTCLWSSLPLIEAAEFYCSIFPNSRFEVSMSHPDGSPNALDLHLNGTRFCWIAGEVPINETFSLQIHCQDQAEVDSYWDRLVEKGEAMQCGWLKDRYGMHWQIIPKRFDEMLSTGSLAQRTAVIEAMMELQKHDLAIYEAVFEEAAN